MVQVDRRTFLKGAAATAGAAALHGPFDGFVALANAATVPASFDDLFPVADQRDGIVRLHLPKDFNYRSFHDTEVAVVLNDGTTLPGRHDGMAAFRGDDGNSILIRNHELNGNAPNGHMGPAGDWTYDTSALGGTTTTEVTRFGEVVNSFTSLNGTQMNCAGGRMPWGAWVSCEETVNGPDVGPDFTGASNVLLNQRHGFIYEVPVDGHASGEPITKAGRFAHEAVAFDPRSGVLYLTEDNFGYPSGFYRYIPPSNAFRKRRIEDGGRLQMLKVKGVPNADLAKRQPRWASYLVDWVDIDDPAPSFPYTPGVSAPTTNDAALNYVGNQGRAQGAAGFSRLEGAVYDDGVIFFCSTQGGGDPEPGASDTVQGWGNGWGQIWAYIPAWRWLTLVYQSPGPDTLDFPDNVTTSERGTLVLCEDSTADNYVRGLSRTGRLWNIALNRLLSPTGASRFNDEFAGSTFSRDGKTLFVNIQASRGITFAIWGPWHRIGV